MSRQSNRVPLRLARFDSKSPRLTIGRSPLLPPPSHVPPPVPPSTPSLLLPSVTPPLPVTPTSVPSHESQPHAAPRRLRSRIRSPVPVHGQAGRVTPEGVTRCSPRCPRSPTTTRAQRATASTTPAAAAAGGLRGGASGASAALAGGLPSARTVARALRAAARVAAINAAVGDALDRCSRQRVADMAGGSSEKKGAQNRSSSPHAHVSRENSPTSRRSWSALLPICGGSSSSLLDSPYILDPAEEPSEAVVFPQRRYVRDSQIRNRLFGASSIDPTEADSSRATMLALPPPTAPPRTPRAFGPGPGPSPGPLLPSSDGPLLPSLVRVQTCVAIAPEVQELRRALEEYSSEGPYAMGLRRTANLPSQQSLPSTSIPSSPQTLRRDFLHQEELWEVLALRQRHRDGHLSPPVRPYSQ